MSFLRRSDAIPVYTSLKLLVSFIQCQSFLCKRAFFILLLLHLLYSHFPHFVLWVYPSVSILLSLSLSRFHHDKIFPHISTPEFFISTNPYSMTSKNPRSLDCGAYRQLQSFLSFLNCLKTIQKNNLILLKCLLAIKIFGKLEICSLGINLEDGCRLLLCYSSHVSQWASQMLPPPLKDMQAPALSWNSLSLHGSNIINKLTSAKIISDLLFS